MIAVYEPIPHPSFPGYFIPRGLDEFVISRNYGIINTRTKNKRKVSVKNHGYLAFSTKYGQCLLHRVYALAFLPVPSPLWGHELSSLQINHKDGNKLNNTDKNLEWCTPKQNMRHAFANKIIGIGKSVQAKHVLTGKIKTFVSMSACAKEFSIETMALARHLKTSICGKISKDWHVFNYENNTWPELTDNDKVESKWNYTSIIVAKNEETKNIFLANNWNDLAQALGFGESSMCIYRQKHGTEKPYKGWYITRHASSVGIDISKLKPLSKDRHKKKDTIYYIKNKTTSEEKVIEGTKKAAEFLDVCEVHLRNYMAKSKQISPNYIVTSSLYTNNQAQSSLVLSKV